MQRTQKLWYRLFCRQLCESSPGPESRFRALLKDGNLLSRPQPEAVLAPVSYRSSRRRRQRKRLLLKGWFSYNRRYRFDRRGLRPIARIEHERSKRSRSPQSPHALTIVYAMFSYNRPNRKTTRKTRGDRNDSGDYMRTSLKRAVST